MKLYILIELKFFVRGVVYQVPNLQDPISDARLPELRHDIKLFKELGLNTLYVCLWLQSSCGKRS